ncbi:MAG TPA: 4-hydroxy-3-methylbut-2-enyl diphosphate reductase [Geobacteraceae bacterium]|nr:4-hydroxy-3-methylbut-2-enyl diphosphate reductase [Geobacteraceae bacterium]
MNIIIAKHAGFCFGVKRATLLAFEKAADGIPTSTLGPIIHSPQVVQRLEEKGVRVVNNLSQLENGRIILRSHGVTSTEMKEAHEKGLEVVDATCPFVRKAQSYVQLLSDEGYEVLVVGDRDHPEVEGIVSYANRPVTVVASAEEARSLPTMKSLGVVAQTTQSYETLEAVVEVCLAKVQELRVFNTICDATSVRQDEAKILARKVDCMVVIGGYNSANTRRLAEICLELQPNTYHVETADQLSEEWFVGKKSVGITAGASTPKWLIDEVIERIKAIGEDKKD